MAGFHLPSPGRFCLPGDTGALGIKARATLKLIPAPRVVEPLRKAIK